ncbi:Cysteinyl-tRNA synthetase-like [[Actinomadura] parvosata subsp. kistnae]|nr:Cysteinyl-tRNA synthetase-like [Actinomadura parvosata subsp. kistnae]
MRLLIARLGELAQTAARRSAGLPALVEPLVELRAELRGKGCYDVADALREAMARGGVSVEDTPTGPRWSVLS